MKSRWAIVSAMVVIIGLAAAAAAVQPPAPAAPAGDPYLAASVLTSEAPADRKPCSFYTPDCAGRPEEAPCSPVAGACACFEGPSGMACFSLG